jgi:hypothetical protein
MEILKYVKLVILIFCSVMFISCFTYGSPDSIFVNFVGRNLDNFVEYEKTGIVNISDKDYTIIYFKKTYDRYTRANNPGDESYLIYKKSSEESEIIIFQGNLGHEIEYVFIDNSINQLYYTFIDIRNDFDKAYLVTFDLNSMQIVNKTVIMDKKKYDKGQFLGGGGYINRCVFDEINKIFLFQINHKLETGQSGGKDYISFNIKTRIVEEISENEYNETLEYLKISTDSYSYVFEYSIKKLFIISPYSDYLPANYKHKYNGIYINDGLNNIRISKINNYSYYSMPVNWIENGQLIIWGAYLFDTSGKLMENKLIDGVVLGIY